MSLRFKRQKDHGTDLNVVPFIDILLVVLIFMALSATFSRYAELQVELPQAQGQATNNQRTDLWLQVNSQSQVWVNQQALGQVSTSELTRHLQQLIDPTQPMPTVIIGADARTQHQAVIKIMEAARAAGLSKITFMSNPAAPKP